MPLCKRASMLPDNRSPSGAQPDRPAAPPRARSASPRRSGSAPPGLLKRMPVYSRPGCFLPLRSRSIAARADPIDQPPELRFSTSKGRTMVLEETFCTTMLSLPTHLPSNTTVVDSGNLSLLWAAVLLRARWRSDYRVGSVSCCGPTTVSQGCLRALKHASVVLHIFKVC